MPLTNIVRMSTTDSVKGAHCTGNLIVGAEAFDFADITAHRLTTKLLLERINYLSLRSSFVTPNSKTFSSSQEPEFSLGQLNYNAASSFSPPHLVRNKSRPKAMPASQLEGVLRLFSARRSHHVEICQMQRSCDVRSA